MGKVRTKSEPHLGQNLLKLIPALNLFQVEVMWGWSPFNPTCHYPQSHQFMPIGWARVVNRPSEPKACLSPAMFCYRA